MEISDYRKKVQACWIGKAVGGTLGMPHEGRPGPLNLTFYKPVPKGLIPNDDLDLQVLWADRLRKVGTRELTTELFKDAWEHQIIFPWDEYGVCKRNLSYDLKGAEIGRFDNWFAEGMGAIIRSEIWACLAPGDPQRAAAFAWHDAVLDHAKDGVWAEVFFAAIEAAAFTETDREKLLDIGWSMLPKDSPLRMAMEQTQKWWGELGDWELIRQRISSEYGTINFTHVVENLCYIVLGWYAGGGDFGKSICVATNCGCDTDCTAASLGSLLAIIDPDCISAEWQAPIAGEVVISAPVIGLEIPKTLDVFTDWVVELRTQLADASPVIGEVHDFGPQQDADSPIVLPVKHSWSEDAGCVSSLLEPVGANVEQADRYGHWLRLEASDFKAPVLIQEYEMHLPVKAQVCVMAWVSQGVNGVWVDGQRIDTSEFRKEERGRRGTPSPHRAQSFVHKTPVLKPGGHKLTVAIPKPEGHAPLDLVMGVTEIQTMCWHPWALAKPNAKQKVNES